MSFHLLQIAFLLFALSACAPKSSTQLHTIQLVDNQGMSQTISTKERLRLFEKVNFLSPQPYQKVLRNYRRDAAGNMRTFITSYYPSGQVMQYLEISNGAANGFYREWHESGGQRVEANVIGGLPDLVPAAEESWIFNGHSYAWDEEGHLLADILYDKGQREGLSLLYHPLEGSPLWQKLPFHRNEIDGQLEIFLEKGELLCSIPYKKGLREGLAQRYWTKEQLASSEHFEKDKLLWGRYFAQNGHLIASIDEGKGERILFGKEGISERHEYEGGLQKGFVYCYHPSGYLVSQCLCSEGLKNGEEIEYYPPSAEGKLQPKISLQWAEGMLQGKVCTYYPSGQLQSVKEMSQNQKQGLYTHYYLDSSLMSIEEYDKDRLVKGQYYKKGAVQPTSTVNKGCGVATFFNQEGQVQGKAIYHNGFPLPPSASGLIETLP